MFALSLASICLSSPKDRPYEVVVVGGGHAGAEAAWAAANVFRGQASAVVLVTLDPSKIGVMPCNPAIGGLAKGQIVREIDALGGLMGIATDATGIMFKVLNTSKGAAVRGPRAQCDKHAYAETVQAMLASRPEIDIVAGSVERVLTEGDRAVGVQCNTAGTGTPFALRAEAVVLTTGTFMRGLMHTGEAKTTGGRYGEAAAVGVSAWLREMDFELGRLKTGTPPRLLQSSIAWDDLPLQPGDTQPTPFSDTTTLDRFPAIEQICCRVTQTTAASHEVIRENLHRAPMFSGQIESAGPRYCPSIEDKIVRFPDRTSHHVFLEPESHRDEVVYCNGISTSFPKDVQEAIVCAMPGCEKATIVQYGYSVEYDCVRPHQIDASCMTKRFAGLFLAGQINGTSGYEEAAGQGLLAGLNAAMRARGEEPVVLGRDTAYIGVMLDDLVTRTPVEPYRMFTSRAEHRLLLRADNAADRLTPSARNWGLVDDARWAVYNERQSQIQALHQTIDATKIESLQLSGLIKQPHYTEANLRLHLGDRIAKMGRGAITTVLAERQYAGYIDRQRVEVKRQAEMESRKIPQRIDYEQVQGLRNEARQSLMRFLPSTFGQAMRLEGVTPADVSILLVHARRRATVPV